MPRFRSLAIRSTMVLTALIAAVVTSTAPAASEPAPRPAAPAAGQRSTTVTPLITTTVRIRSRTVVVEGVRIKVPTVTVTGPSRRIARSIEAMTAAEVRTGLRKFTARHLPSTPESAEYRMTAAVVANTSPTLSILFREYANYGNTGLWRFSAVTVDTRTGRRWTTSAIATAVQRAARPGVTLLTEMRRAAGTGDVQRDRIALTNTTLVPTRAGLGVHVDQCTLFCMVGPVSVTLPWSDLLAPGTRLPFSPW